MLRFHHYNHYFGALDASSPLLESRKRITLVIHFSPRCKVKIPRKQLTTAAISTPKFIKNSHFRKSCRAFHSLCSLDWDSRDVRAGTFNTAGSATLQILQDSLFHSSSDPGSLRIQMSMLSVAGIRPKMSKLSCKDESVHIESLELAFPVH